MVRSAAAAGGGAAVTPAARAGRVDFTQVKSTKYLIEARMVEA